MKGSSIRSVELYKLFVPLKEPFIISLGPTHSVQNLIVIIRTADGCAGYGECSPFMAINGESIDTCFVVGQYFATVLRDKDALDIEGCTGWMEKTIYANYSVKSAFDMALFDIASQHAGQPLYRFLGGEKNKTLETDMTVSLGDAEKMKTDAKRFLEEGFPAIKVKLGGTREDDVARIKAIRDGIGDEVPLRIDANQGWQNADYAIEVLKALGDFNIEHCEEPISRYRYMELPKVSAASPIPVMADESCGDEWDAKRLIELKACPMFNIKLGKSGGLLTAKKIAEAASAAGIKMQVGGFMESRLGMTASAHFALCNHDIIHCDFDTPLMFTEDPVIGGLQYLKNGKLDVPDTPGLGAVIDDSYLKEAETWNL